MQHRRVYDMLISRAQSREPLSGYMETHHILPKALGGLDDPSNLVKLTAREHYVAHLLLAKIYGGSMWFAVVRMSNFRNKYFNSRLYEVARKQIGLIVKQRQTGMTYSAKHRQNISNALKGKPLASSTIAKLSKARKNRVITPEWREKLRIANTGKKLAPFTAEHKEKMRQAQLRRWAKTKEAKHAV